MLGCFYRSPEPIQNNDTAGTLGARLADTGARLLVKALHAVLNGQIVREPQPSQGVTFAPALTKEMQRLDFSRPAAQLHCLIRGLDPKPGAFTLYQEKVLKVFQPRLGSRRPHLPPPGTVLQLGAAGVEVACGDGTYGCRSYNWPVGSVCRPRNLLADQSFSHLRLG